MSETPKWTAGPWQAIKAAYSEGFVILTQPNLVLRGFTKSIGHVGDQADEETAANANLIAASPDLAHVAAMLLCVDFDNFTEHDELLLESVLADARAALAKARGETP